MTDDLMDYEDDTDELASEGRAIEDDLEAGRMLRGLLSRRRQIERLEQRAEAEKRRIDAWLAEHTSRLRSEVEFVEQTLKDYHRLVLSKSPKAKTLHFPYGKLSSTGVPKATPIGVEVEDEDAFRKYAEAEELEVFGDPKPVPIAKSALTALTNAGYLLNVLTVTDDGLLVNADGEAVPGVKAHKRETSFRVEAIEPAEEGDENG